MSAWWWIGFNALVLLLLLVDLGVFHRKAHVVTAKEAAIWSIVWVSLAIGFNIFVYYQFGAKAATDFLTGYIVEESLSVDNLFVFVLIFNYFAVPAEYQHRILFWGIIGALIMRASLIVFGAFLVEQFEWILYLFGAFLIYTGIRMAFESETSVEIEANPIIKLMRRWFPVTNVYHGQKFFFRDSGRLMATPMLVVLVLIESTDLVFALDSIPAIFGITRDTFIVYTSNIFAILGLRSLYFLLATVIERFHLLKYGLAAILSFVGIKMLIEHWLPIDKFVSLGIVIAMLALSVIASLVVPPKPHAEPQPVPIPPPDADAEAREE